MSFRWVLGIFLDRVEQSATKHSPNLQEDQVTKPFRMSIPKLEVPWVAGCPSCMSLDPRLANQLSHSLACLDPMKRQSCGKFGIKNAQENIKQRSLGKFWQSLIRSFASTGGLFGGDGRGLGIPAEG